MLADHDRARMDALRRLDDLPAGLAGRPREVGVEAFAREDLARLVQMLDDVRRRADRPALAGGRCRRVSRSCAARPGRAACSPR